MLITFARLTVIGMKFQIHGVLNVVSWGILMPLGVIIARYLRVFKSADPAWFYLHVTCQTSAYIIGVSGWATGLKLGNDSAGVQYTKHRTLGILLFILATLQVSKILLIHTINAIPHIFYQSLSLSLLRKNCTSCLGVCFASKAEQGSQIQILLEYLSPFSWVFCHPSQHH